MKISLLCPTRLRPESMERVWKSAQETADDPSSIEIVFYMDNDDPLSISKFQELDTPESNNRVLGILGERILLSSMWNECQKVATGDIFMLLGDDIVFRSPHWDTYVREHFNSIDDKISLLYGRDGNQDERLSTHPFVHKNWIQAVGYFVPDSYSCDMNDLNLFDIATMINRKTYDPRIFTEHMHFGVGKSNLDSTYKDQRERGMRDNVMALYERLLPKRQEDAQKLRDFINNFNK